MDPHEDEFRFHVLQGHVQYRNGISLRGLRWLWKYHLNDYNNLPIYWYKAIDDKLKIGYYHTLKDVIDKEKGIKTNYLNNHLYYKLK